MHFPWRLSANEEDDASQALAHLQGGNYEQAFRLLWQVFGWRVGQFARCLLGPPSRRPRGMAADEDDVAQEVFLQLFNHATKGVRPALEDPDSLCGFLIGRTKAEVADQRRRATSPTRGGGKTYDEAALTIATGAKIEQIPGEWPLPEDIISAQEHWHQLLGRLDRDVDRALLVARVDGLTFTEIAQRFELTTGSIRARYHRIIQKLQSFEASSERPISERDAAGELTALLLGPPPEPGRRAHPQRLALAPAASVDPVDCTVFAPPAACPGNAILIQVVAHTPSQTAKAKALAREFDEEAERRGYTSLETDVERGSRLLFHLAMPGLEIDQPLRSLVWRGRPASVQFRVVVPTSHPFQSVIGTVTVTEEYVPQGQITFKVKVVPRTTAAPPSPSPTGQAKAFEVFFISYASEDRPEVLKRVQMLARLGKRFFQDLLHLDPGDRWERKLYVYIDQSDAVLLFWSSNAKQSEWVMRECRYTIDNKGIDCLLPVIIEGPPPVEPPPELAELHMNDWLLYFMR